MNAPDVTYRFAGFSVHPATRELRRRGEVLAIPPLIFDVLVYLIEHRDRVVRKEEIFQQVWRGTVVTDGALARAISKARLAVGDSADEPELIKTVNRVGYRFVGAVVHSPELSDALDAASGDDGVEAVVNGDHVAVPIRVALLPFVNDTGQSQNDWIDLGLMSLVRHALQLDDRLTLIPTADTFGVVKDLRPEASALEMAATVHRRLTAHCVVRCTISAVPIGYRAYYVGYGPKAMGMTGYLEDAELVRLGQRIAETIEARLSAGNVRAVPFQCTDPFANQALARALEAQARQLQETAALYFRVVLDLEPSNPRVRILAVRCFATYSADEAIEIAKFLLSEVAEASDTRLKAAAHEATGAAMWHRDPAAADFHLKEAVRLIQDGPPDDEMARIYASNGLAATGAADNETARELFQVVETISRATGNDSRLCWVLNNLASFDLYEGDFAAATRRVDEAIMLARRLVQPVTLCALMGTLAEINWSQGALANAAEICDAMCVELPQCHYELTLAAECFAAAGIYRDAGELARLAAVVDMVHTLTSDKDLRVMAMAAATGAMQALAQHHGSTAVALLRQAAELGLQAKDYRQVQHFLLLLAEAHIRLDEPDRAALVLEQISGLPTFTKDALLQRNVRYLNAAIAHLNGDADAALTALADLAIGAPPNRISSLVLLNAAWLSIEAGKMQAASDFIARVGPVWMASHPLGLSVAARHAYASGRQIDAFQALRQCLDFYAKSAAPEWLVQLQHVFAASRVCPAIPRLPSLI